MVNLSPRLLSRGLVPVLLLALGCTTAPTQTIRHPGMNYLEFIARADIMVEKHYPEWHVL